MKGDCPIVALIKKYDERDSEVVATYSKDEVTNEYARALYDLFFAPEKKVGWVNVYKNEYGAYVLGEIFIGKEHEEVTTGLIYITTAKIEWEE